MVKEAKVITADLGSTWGKVGALSLKGGKLCFQPLHRFLTQGLLVPMKANRRYTLVWNVPRFLEEIVGVLRAESFLSVGIDSWGIDFALLDSWGRLISLPVHYRDQRTEGVMKEASKVMGQEEVFRHTGVYPMPINTLYQLYSMVLSNDPQLDLAKTILMIPNLFNYWLGAETVCEYTIATTSQCYSIKDNTWAWDVLKRFSIPDHLFPDVVPPGSVLGKCRFGGKVVATACHDTASAVAAIPFSEPGIYVSSGTWSLIGVELPEPIITPEALAWGFTNEGGYGCIRFLKNCTGMWILEECNKEWGLSYEEITYYASVSPPFQSFIDPDDPRFLYTGSMTTRIKAYLHETGQALPKDLGGYIRTIFESLVFNYKWVIEKLELVTKMRFETIYVVGGGAKNKMVNQMIADATGKEVLAGLYEASSIGNGLIQFIALGKISNLAEGRNLVRSSFPLQHFEPASNRVQWIEAYQKWKEITGKK